MVGPKSASCHEPAGTKEAAAANRGLAWTLLLWILLGIHSLVCLQPIGAQREREREAPPTRPDCARDREQRSGTVTQWNRSTIPPTSLEESTPAKAPAVLVMPSSGAECCEKKKKTLVRRVLEAASKCCGRERNARETRTRGSIAVTTGRAETVVTSTTATTQDREQTLVQITSTATTQDREQTLVQITSTAAIVSAIRSADCAPRGV
eukprot:1179270-Prorocentrum_minimum.AAC.1